MASRLHERYIERKHGREKVAYHHPLLEDLPKETYGVLLYQEQIMRVAQNMGGFRLEDADSPVVWGGRLSGEVAGDPKVNVRDSRQN